MSSHTIAILSLIVSAVSAFAAVFGVLAFMANRREIISFGANSKIEWSPIAQGEIIAKGKKGKKEHIVPFNNGFLIHLQFLNPSPNDIAYFGMQFQWDGKIIEPWTHKSFGYLDGPIKIILLDPLHTAEIPIPPANQGVFKANSFNPLYVFASTDEGPLPQKATFSFKYAVRKFPYIGKRNHYSTFSAELNLTKLPELQKLQIESMKQWTQPMQSKKGSNSTPPYSSRKRNKHKK